MTQPRFAVLLVDDIVVDVEGECFDGLGDHDEHGQGDFDGGDDDDHDDLGDLQELQGVHGDDDEARDEDDDGDGDVYLVVVRALQLNHEIMEMKVLVYNFVVAFLAGFGSC